MPKIAVELNARGASSAWLAIRKILHLRIRGRRVVLATAVAALLCAAVNTLAQEERPQIIPGERKAQRKKSQGPRAVGLLRMAPDGKTSLVPIAILINGKFWDAAAYKADPVPMALDYGTIYEAERAGNSLGLFTVASALRRNSTANGAQPLWIGTGKYLPNGSEPEKKGEKAEAVPVGIDVTNGPPRLTRDPAKMNAPPDSASGKGSSSSGGSAPPTAGSTSSDEPPRFTKTDSSTPGSSPDSTSPAKPPSDKGEDKGDKKTADTKPAPKADEVKIPASDSGAKEGNRPRLRRGTPEVAFAEEEVPGYSKPGTKAPAQGDLSKAAAVATQGDLQLVPAISDSGGPEIHSFVFNWLKGEEDDRRKQMTDFARDQLRDYIAARAKASVTGTGPHSTAIRSTAKSKDPVLENVSIVAYDVWLSNQPVMILSAEGHMAPPAPGATHSEIDTELQYWVTVVAYPDIYNNLHKVYVGITDKFHLDVTPRLELIDALDADGDNRGELLFRETTDQGTGWVIYRPTADKLWKMFDSLRPE